MNSTTFDLKNICNYENELKDYLKKVKFDIPDLNRKYEIKANMLNKLQAFSLVILGLNLIIPGNKTAGNVLGITIYLLITLSKWVEEKMNDLNNAYLLEYMDDLNETIDAIELLKDFLRNRSITTEEKILIIERLYLIYKDNLNDILSDIEKEKDVKITLTRQKNIR